MNEQWRFNLPKIDPRLKVPLLEAIQKRVIKEVKAAFAPEPDEEPEDQTCRFPDFPWTNGGGGLPYDGLFDLTRPRRVDLLTSTSYSGLFSETGSVAWFDLLTSFFGVRFVCDRLQ